MFKLERNLKGGARSIKRKDFSEETHVMRGPGIPRVLEKRRAYFGHPRSKVDFWFERVNPNM